MTTENKVNSTLHNYMTKAGVSMLIEIVEPLAVHQIDNNTLTVLIEALKYWSTRALATKGE